MSSPLTHVVTPLRVLLSPSIDITVVFDTIKAEISCVHKECNRLFRLCREARLFCFDEPCRNSRHRLQVTAGARAIIISRQKQSFTSTNHFESLCPCSNHTSHKNTLPHTMSNRIFHRAVAVVLVRAHKLPAIHIIIILLPLFKYKNNAISYQYNLN